MNSLIKIKCLNEFNEEVNNKKDTKEIYIWLKKKFPHIKMKYKNFVIVFAALMNSSIIVQAADTVNKTVNKEIPMWSNFLTLVVGCIIVGCIKDIVENIRSERWFESIVSVLTAAVYTLIAINVPSIMNFVHVMLSSN